MIDLTHQDGIYTLTMNAGENRWGPEFTRAFTRRIDEVEADPDAKGMITCSADEKFFSNGLDLDWANAPETHTPGNDRATFGVEFMDLMGRLITFPIPTIAAINGHAFGAGMMVALCHDVRMMRADRGFICANEMLIGVRTPTPELALFKHKLSATAFFETIQLARRWTGEAALAAGVVQSIHAVEDLPAAAMERALQLAPLAANRALYGEQKERLFGENAVLNGPHGAAHLLKNSADFR